MGQEAKLEHVVALLKSLDDQWICVDGGWGVDALLNVQTRPHADLDLIIRKTDVAAIELALTNQQFHKVLEADGLVYASSELVVDLHPVRIDSKHYGHFDLPNGGSWPFPPETMGAEGLIGDFRVRCLSVDAQVQCHAQGYVLTPKDIDDMRALQAKFGCVLPLRFYIEGAIPYDT